MNDRVYMDWDGHLHLVQFYQVIGFERFFIVQSYNPILDFHSLLMDGTSLEKIFNREDWQRLE